MRELTPKGQREAPGQVCAKLPVALITTPKFKLNPELQVEEDLPPPHPRRPGVLEITRDSGKDGYAQNVGQKWMMKTLESQKPTCS